MCLFERAQLAAAAGDIDSAGNLREELVCAPAGAFFQIERLCLDLLIGFARQTSADIEDDLYEITKSTLRMNRFGLVLSLAAWAFNDRGETEMAILALTEALPRLSDYHLMDAFPSLHAWM